LVLLFAALGTIPILAAVPAVIEIDLVNNILAKLGKDSTLTGRTFIWSIGWQLFEWKPIFGIGFDAFWHAGIFEETRRIYEALGEGINGFHNTFLEVLVSIGLVGGAVYVMTLIVVMVRLTHWFFVSRTIETMGAVFIVSLMIVISFVDVIGFRNHDLSHILMVTFFVIAQKENGWRRKREEMDPGFWTGV
jgi:O-antigen ligase